MDSLWANVAAVIPSIGVGIIFYFVMRSVIRADKTERAQLAELDREENLESEKLGTSE